MRGGARSCPHSEIERARGRRRAASKHPVSHAPTRLQAVCLLPIAASSARESPRRRSRRARRRPGREHRSSRPRDTGSCRAHRGAGRRERVCPAERHRRSERSLSAARAASRRSGRATAFVEARAGAARCEPLIATSSGRLGVRRRSAIRRAPDAPAPLAPRGEERSKGRGPHPAVTDAAVGSSTAGASFELPGGIFARGALVRAASCLVRSSGGEPWCELRAAWCEPRAGAVAGGSWQAGRNARVVRRVSLPVAGQRHAVHLLSERAHPLIANPRPSLGEDLPMRP
jgi:hypothetical protein